MSAPPRLVYEIRYQEAMARLRVLVCDACGIGVL